MSHIRVLVHILFMLCFLGVGQMSFEHGSGDKIQQWNVIFGLIKNYVDQTDTFVIRNIVLYKNCFIKD